MARADRHHTLLQLLGVGTLVACGALAVAMLGGCRGEPPTWQRVLPAAGSGEPLARSFRLGDGRLATLRPAAGHAWLEQKLRRSDWRPVARAPGFWRASVSLRGRGAPVDGTAAERLVAPSGVEYPYVRPYEWNVRGRDAVEPGQDRPDRGRSYRATGRGQGFPDQAPLPDAASARPRQASRIPPSKDRP